METTRPTEAQSFDVLIVGAGLAGLYALHKLRGQGLSVRVIEAGAGVGGTWYWNRYPGARVDIESEEYSYSFSEELEETWIWSERYAAQPELLSYINHVADRFDLRRDIAFETRVVSAAFDEARNLWRIATDRGDLIAARYCIMATGCLSVPKEPDFPGVDTFKGVSLHTARWPERGYDFTGKKVGIVGTGSTAIQTITAIAPQCAHLTVFQRTPNFSVPAHNGPADPAIARRSREERRRLRAAARQEGFAIRQIDQQETLATETPPEEIKRRFEDRWARGGFSLAGAFGDIIFTPQANAACVDFVHGKIADIVKDRAIAEKLMPKTYPIVSKRLCVDTGYYEVFNRDNVSLVDISETPIEAITPTGVRTSAAEYDLDCIIYAIGFDAMTGALSRIDIKGRGGRTLTDKWADGPRTYLGLMVAGFPNLFLVTGPGSPSVLSNMIVSIEQHVDWIAACIAWLGERQRAAIEATEAAEQDWVDHVNEVAHQTLYPQAKSWYMGANVPGKPRLFMPYIGGFPAYLEKCEAVAARDYEGCVVSAA